MDQVFRWGIIGPGKIAQKLAAALQAVPGAILHAVASRDSDNARAFAQRFHAPVAYGSYAELAADPDIDVVYIATPHSFHHAHALLCLQQHKAVLCEKPMSVNLASTEEMVQTARENRVFLMEAMWTRFLPIIDKTKELVQQGVIGDLKYLCADFGFHTAVDPSSRLYNLSLGGGSLLDVGIYPLFLALFLMGMPDAVNAFSQLAITGADETTSALLFYKDGRMANIVSSITAQTPIAATITGTDGSIMLERPWYKGNTIRVRKNDQFTDEFFLPYGDNGFEFQVREVQHCLEQALTESPKMPLQLSLAMAGVMEQICHIARIRYTVQS